MSLAALIALWGASRTRVSGQQQWTTPGATSSFVVPAGVYEVSAVTVSAGVDGSGGALRWKNGIPVVPGETLTVYTGGFNINTGGDPLSTIKRGVTTLMPVGSNGGMGGMGSRNSPTAGGGGAGGYMGNGGSGGNPGAAPALNSGGGKGGDPYNDGGGVGLQGRAADFAPGSLGDPKCGGGIGEGAVGGSGGVRIMWGPGRFYPDRAADV